MARTYKRDSSGRFAGGGGGSGGGRPKAKAAPRGVNRLTRDNAGKITSVGGNGATARGGRIRTASGKLRATQTASLKGGARAGTIKGTVKRNPGVGAKLADRGGNGSKKAASIKPPREQRVQRIKEKINSKAKAVADEIRKVDNAKSRNNDASYSPRYQKLVDRGVKADKTARSVNKAAKALRKIELASTPEKFGFARGSDQRKKLAATIRQERQGLSSLKKAAAKAEKAYKESPVVKYGLWGEVGGNRRQSRKAKQAAGSRQTNLVDSHISASMNVRSQQRKIQELRQKAKAQTSATNKAGRRRR